MVVTEMSNFIYLYEFENIDEFYYVINHMEPYIDLLPYEGPFLGKLPSVGDFVATYFKELRKLNDIPLLESRRRILYDSTEHVLKNIKKYRELMSTNIDF
jgi:hypothetical protein